MIRASLTTAFSANSASRAALAASRAPKKASWAPRNRFQRASSTSLGAGPAAFQSRIRSRYLPAVGPHSVERGKRLGLLGQALLDHPGALALLVLLGEVRLAAPGVGRARAGEALPQRVVGGAVDARQGLPQLQQVAQLVGATAPVVAGRDLLGLGDQLLLLGLGLGGLLGLLDLAGLTQDGEHGAEGVEATDQRGEVADGVGVADLGADCLDRLRGLLGCELGAVDPLLEELHLEGERGEALGEEVKRLLRCPCRVGPHRSFAIGGPDIHGAVVVDAAPFAARHCASLFVVHVKPVPMLVVRPTGSSQPRYPRDARP